jgi:hypothetical protein
MNRRFARLVKRIRLKMRCTQKSFALLIAVPLSTYKSWEYWRCLPTFEHLGLLQLSLKSYSKELDAAYMADRLGKETSYTPLGG